MQRAAAAVHDAVRPHGVCAPVCGRVRCRPVADDLPVRERRGKHPHGVGNRVRRIAATGPGGASSGISYWGSPSLAGDAPAIVQISYAAPSQSGNTTPYTVVSFLPDANYLPLATASTIFGGFSSFRAASDAVASGYWTTTGARAQGTLVAPVVTSTPPVTWSGAHRLFAIARASTNTAGASAQIAAIPDGSLVAASTVAAVPIGQGWAPYDLGTFSLRPSQTPPPTALQFMTYAPNAALDVSAFVTLPDNTSWFLNGGQFPYGGNWPAFNVLLLDDTLNDQFAYTRGNMTFAPSPTGMTASSTRITQYTRGLVQRPDPKNGMPIIAILGVAGGGSPAAQNLPTFAQVNVLERTRYIFG